MAGRSLGRSAWSRHGPGRPGDPRLAQRRRRPRTRPRRTRAPDKPIAAGHLEPGTVCFAIAVAVLLVVPLSIANGMRPARVPASWRSRCSATWSAATHRFSFLPWAARTACSRRSCRTAGGPARRRRPPADRAHRAGGTARHRRARAALAARTGRRQQGRPDHSRCGSRSDGAPRLLLVASVYTAAVAAGILIAALRVGLVQ